MTPEPSAYLYEFKVVPIDGAGWEERVGIRHPDDLGFTGSESLEFRNVRPLYENEPVEEPDTCEDCNGQLDDDGICPHCHEYEEVGYTDNHSNQ